MTTHGHLNNWAILVTFLATAGFCYIASQCLPTTRWAWRQADKFADERDEALQAEVALLQQVKRLETTVLAVRVENEHLTDDLAAAAHKEQVVREQLGYVSEQLARQIKHPSQRRDAELFERLEKDFS